MNAALIVAGSIGVLAAAIHGGAGEMLVVRKLSRETLAPSRFGGPGMTKAMIHVTGHVTTVAVLTLGVGLIVAGSALDGDAAEAVAVLSATGFTGFAALAVGVGGSYMPSPRSLIGHPGPIVLSAAAALAWWGAL